MNDTRAGPVAVARHSRHRSDPRALELVTTQLLFLAILLRGGPDNQGWPRMTVDHSSAPENERARLSSRPSARLLVILLRRGPGNQVLPRTSRNCTLASEDEKACLPSRLFTSCHRRRLQAGLLRGSGSLTTTLNAADSRLCSTMVLSWRICIVLPG